jgi:GDP-D-mannose 3', 5'-epimerase
MGKQELIVVAGAGGFIGGHLVQRLLQEGRRVRAVDQKPVAEWYQVHPGVENLVLDLALLPHAMQAVTGAEQVYNLAADMGGMGFIELNKARCMLSVLINTHLLLAAREQGVARFFFSSSACVYNADKQKEEAVTPLREDDAYPAMPEDGYGWEKLFSERMCRHFREDFGLATRVARYHNVYGPLGTWDGGREKAPAALCRKVAHAKRARADTLEIWGDGHQTRSFTYIDDCIEGTRRLMDSEVVEPLNIGSSELVSIDQLSDIVQEIAGVQLRRVYAPGAPKGVAGRNSDNSRILELFDWEPATPLRVGMATTYHWIEEQIAAQARGERVAV